MNCQSCRNEIEELELGESLSGEASAHVGACLPCGAFYNERLSLRRLVGSLEPVSAPTDFEFRLRARLAASGNSGNHHHSFWRSFFSSTPAIGVAATFALLVVGVVLYNQFKSAPVAANQPGGNVERSAGQKSEIPNANSSNPITASKDLPEAAGPENNNSPSPLINPPSNNNSPSRLATNNKNIVRHQLRRLDSGNAPILTNDIASRGAPQIMPGDGSPLTASSNPLVELPVRSASQPMRVFVDDKSGGQRAVTLKPVIFGSQDLTGRNDSLMATSQGIW
jgi:hypothetical protein